MNDCWASEHYFPPLDVRTHRDVLDSVESETVRASLLEDPVAPVAAGQRGSVRLTSKLTRTPSRHPGGRGRLQVSDRLSAREFALTVGLVKSAKVDKPFSNHSQTSGSRTIHSPCRRPWPSLYRHPGSDRLTPAERAQTQLTLKMAVVSDLAS